MSASRADAPLSSMLLKYLRFAVIVAAVVTVATIGIRGATRAATRADVPIANLWIDMNGGQCARSGSAVAYRDANACGSIDEAWDACRPRDTIVIRNGVYGAQTVTGSKAAPGCTIRGESGTTIGDLLTSADNFTLANVTVDVGAEKIAGWKNRASNVTLRNVRLRGSFVVVDIFRSSNVSWIGGELGTAGQTGGARVCGQDAQPVQIGEADHITFSAIRFHPQDADLTPSACSFNGAHLEMVRIDGGTSFMTLRDSTFDSGDHSNTASVFITEPGSSDPNNDPHDLTFENNFFGTNDAVVGAFDVHQNVSPCANFTFAYNTFLKSPGAFNCTSAVNVKWIANLGPSAPGPTCFGSSVANVWQDTLRDNCGRDRWVSGPRGQTGRLGLGGPDGFHLQPGSPAIDAGEAAGYCTTSLRSLDHDGRARQIGARCDAGADEYQRGAAVVGSIARARLRRSGAGRILTLILKLRETVAADIRVVQGGRTLARTRRTRLEAGTRVATLSLGDRIVPGSARIRAVLTDVAKNHRRVERTVRIP